MVAPPGYSTPVLLESDSSPFSSCQGTCAENINKQTKTATNTWSSSHFVQHLVYCFLHFSVTIVNVLKLHPTVLCYDGNRLSFACLADIGTRTSASLRILACRGTWQIDQDRARDGPAPSSLHIALEPWEGLVWMREHVLLDFDPARTDLAICQWNDECRW